MRQFIWVFEVIPYDVVYMLQILQLYELCSEYASGIWIIMQDAKTKNVEHILILSGDQLYRMNYMDLLQVLVK